MRHSLWALALLALSLPAPALSDPLHDLPGTDTLWWNEPYRTGAPRALDTDRRWWQERADLDDAGEDIRPGRRWRPRTAYGPFGRPGFDDGYRSVYPDRDAPSPGDGSGPWRGRRIPLAVVPNTPQPLRRCGPGPALVGAAIGGGLGAALSDGSRQRQWALPIGATVGGLLGGVLAGC